MQRKIWPPNKEFLLAQDARILAKLQVEHDRRHNNDFWHYWGTDRHFRQRVYANAHWSWKTELHFHKSVSVKSLAAILWPYELWGHGKGAMRRELIGGNSAKRQFERICPTCKVIPYCWTTLAPTLSLVRASFAVASYLALTKQYPVSADDALRFLKT